MNGVGAESGNVLNHRPQRGEGKVGERVSRA